MNERIVLTNVRQCSGSIWLRDLFARALMSSLIRMPSCRLLHHVQWESRCLRCAVGNRSRIPYFFPFVPMAISQPSSSSIFFNDACGFEVGRVSDSCLVSASVGTPFRSQKLKEMARGEHRSPLVAARVFFYGMKKLTNHIPVPDSRRSQRLPRRRRRFRPTRLPPGRYPKVLH